MASAATKGTDRANSGTSECDQGCPADGGYRTSAVQYGARLGIAMEVVDRPRVKGFEPVRKRWVIERTFG